MTWIKSHQINFEDTSSLGEIYKYWIDTWLPTLGFTVAGLSSAPNYVGEACTAFGTAPADDEFSRFVSWTYTNLMTGNPVTQTHFVDWYSATNSYLRWGFPQNLECNKKQGGANSTIAQNASNYGVCGIRADWNFRWDWQSNVYYFNDSSRYAYGQDVRFWVSDQNPGAGMVTQGRRIKWYWPGFTELREWEDNVSPHYYATWMAPMGESYWIAPGMPYYGSKWYYDEESCGYYKWDDQDYRGRFAPHFRTGAKWYFTGRDDGKSYLFKNAQILKSSDYQYYRTGWDNAYWGTLPDDVLIYSPYKCSSVNGYSWNGVSVAQQVVTDGSRFYLSTYTLNDTVSCFWFDFGTTDPSPELPLLDS